MPKKLMMVAIALSAVLAGCGQTGALYLPDEGGQIIIRQGTSTAPTPAPAPAPAPEPR